jgi:succinate-semialdehyde dehydrogenase/glutarate-semialdehyde dehydrogenase
MAKAVLLKRIIAVESIADEFIEKFTAKLAQMKVVINGSKYGTRPLSSEEALLHLLDQVERSVAAELPFYWVVTE